ncbi:Panacea domain-containing protein [Amycolatopsis pigmentata]|uniref:Panacea domain-containing protein n=1 Tax=Amycolatopsis pigmentata TaxID=450801 RepID=A0ABW5FX33_9PSEU
MCAHYNASTVAKWFVAWAEADDEATLSNLKLQKLLYYAQGHYLALTGRPLFDDEIQAWSHGPVVPAVYRQWNA